MKHIITWTLLIAIFPVSAGACWDYWEFTRVEIGVSGPEAATLMVTPAGSGSAMTNARLPHGEIVDASITLHLRDCYDIPIAAFPREDMWLESADGGLSMCVGGTTADADTDAQGIATWTQPLAAGGSSQALCQVMINGLALPYSPGLLLHFNSPDINGDGAVNIMDVPLMAADFYGAGSFRSDLARDGRTDLGDIVKFAQALGSSCP